LPTYSPFSPPSPTGFPQKLPDILPLARGHTAPVLDTAWSPFDDSLVTSAGEDGKSAYGLGYMHTHVQLFGMMADRSLPVEDRGLAV
jgi:hypothetical protein